jgi:hypothetical protein
MSLKISQALSPVRFSGYKAASKAAYDNKMKNCFRFSTLKADRMFRRSRVILSP